MSNQDVEKSGRYIVRDTVLFRSAGRSGSAKKRAKKRPKPKACERWGIYDRHGSFVIDATSEAVARSYCIGGRFMHRVRIVPVVAKYGHLPGRGCNKQEATNGK